MSSEMLEYYTAVLKEDNTEEVLLVMQDDSDISSEDLDIFMQKNGIPKQALIDANLSEFENVAA